MKSIKKELQEIAILFNVELKFYTNDDSEGGAYVDLIRNIPKIVIDENEEDRAALLNLFFHELAHVVETVTMKNSKFDQMTRKNFKDLTISELKYIMNNHLRIEKEADLTADVLLKMFYPNETYDFEASYFCPYIEDEIKLLFEPYRERIKHLSKKRK